MFADTYTCTADILAVTDKYMRVRSMAVQLPNMGCNFLACILLAYRKPGKSRAQDFVLDTNEKDVHCD